MSEHERTLIFALDTSSVLTVFGLTKGDAWLAEERFCAPIQLRDRLPFQLQRFLRDHEAAHGPIDAIALAIGPGSFTGLRVSLSLAKGIAFARGIPIWPVSSLKVLAENARGMGRAIASIIPARKGECYLGLFDSDELLPLHDSICIDHVELEIHVPRDAVLLGPAVAELSLEIREKLAAQLSRSRPHFHLPSAFHLAELAGKEWQGKEPPDLASLTPFYLKDFPA